LMMSLWDALRMNMMISYQELVRTFLKPVKRKIKEFFEHFDLFRVSCIYKGEIDSLLNIIREFYSVK
ncbi:hypothetical protein ABN323_22590, partial [Escherichia coli]